MKNTVQLRWFGMMALILALLGVGLQFQSAQAQYEYGGSPYGSAPAAMTERGGFLFIVQGNTLHKVRTKDLVVVGRVRLNPLYPQGTPYPTASPRWDEGTPMPTPTTTGAPTPTSINPAYNPPSTPQ